MKRILESEQIMLKISASRISGTDGPTTHHFIEGSSLHYLYRPDLLESCTLNQFTIKYEVRNRKRYDDDEDLLTFKSGHPAQEIQYIVERTTSVIAGINNWEFIDTARFGGDLLDPNIVVDEQTEDYAKTVLILCHPFRTKEDLMYKGSYVLKFRLLAKKIYNTYGTMLQNIQDIRNAVRCRHQKDDLEATTEAFKSETNEDNSKNEEDLDENKRQHLDVLYTNMTYFDSSDVQNTYGHNINDTA